jgi:hypothetical protein
MDAVAEVSRRKSKTTPMTMVLVCHRHTAYSCGWR